MRRELASRWRSPAWRRGLTIAFVSIVVALIVNQAREVDWPAVLVSLQAYRGTTIATAAALTVASYCIYVSYDLLGRHLTRHDLKLHEVAGVAFDSYAFNLNFGSLIGGVALRYRLYSRLGLGADVITQVLAISIVTNWLGYAALAGGVLLLRPLALPPGWHLGDGALRALGVALLIPVGAYLAACFSLRRRRWRFGRSAVRLPRGSLAVVQLLLSCLNWLLIAAIVHTLLHRQIDFADVLSGMLAAAVAGVIMHVPAGLGVLEVVFLTLMAQRAAPTDIVAALLAYRAIYYVAPLVPAIMHYLFVGERARDGATPPGRGAKPDAQSRPISSSTSSTIKTRPNPPLGP